tara:strand:- start:569 stop:1249 length:681 start_codon:yes stop_codon:yes gene_type:complete
MKNNKLDIFKKLLFEKKGLLKCIFSTLLFQVTITALVVLYIYKNPNTFDNLVKNVNGFILIMLLLIIDIFLIIVMVSFNISFNARFIIFVIFSIAQGLFLGAVTKYVPSEIISSALVSTIAIFLTFLLAGFIIVYFGYDLSWMGIYLFIALLGVIILQIVFMFIPPSRSNRRYTVIFVLVLFSIYILYDTNNVLLKYQDTGIDCIRGALDYYLDILNIFIYSLDSR